MYDIYFLMLYKKNMLNEIFDIIIIAHNYDDIIFNDITEFIKICANRRCILLLDNNIENNKFEHDLLKIENLQITSSFSVVNSWIAQSKENILFLDSKILLTNNCVKTVSISLASDASIGTISPILANRIGYKCLNTKKLEKLEKVVQHCSLNLSAETTRANELCVYINRKVFDYGIAFDWKLFQNIDQMIAKFCVQISQFGLRHITSDSFIIFDSNISLNEVSCIENKLLYIIYDNIKLYLSTENNKRNILLQLHSDFIGGAENSIGGTQLHVKDLVNSLKKSFNLYVIARDKSNINLTIYVENEQFRFKFDVGLKGEAEQFYNKKYKDIYMTIIKAFHIDLIHIHHALGMTRELFFVGAALQIPIVASIHDYYYVCPSILMLDGENKICIDNADPEICSECLQARLGKPIEPNYLKVWRSESLKVLNLCEKLVTPSNNTSHNFSKYFPQLTEKIKVIEHGTDMQKIYAKSLETKKKNFHIAFIGSLGPEKGSRYAYEMIKHGPKSIKWFICGNIEEYQLLLHEQKNLVKLGSYKRDNLPQLLNDNEIDLVCILSICPETYSYTLSEVLCCGIPVMVMDSGALGERVRDLQCGWIVSPESTYEDILNALDKIQSDTVSYNKIRSRINLMHLRNVEEMSKDYEILYSQMPRPTIESSAYDSNLIYCAFQRANGIETDFTDINLYAELESLRYEINQIKNSWAYLFMFKIFKRLKIPFKNTIKRYIFRSL